MNRKLGFGALSLLAALSVSFLVPEDADAFGRRKRRHGGGCGGGYATASHGCGSSGYSSVGCSTGGHASYGQQYAAPVATSNCNACTVGHSGNWSGGHNSSYGQGQSVMGGHQGQPTLSAPPAAPQGGAEAGATFRGDNATQVNPAPSPSDRTGAPSGGASNDDRAVQGISGADSGNNANASQAPARSAPPAPPSEN